MPNPFLKLIEEEQGQPSAASPSSNPFAAIAEGKAPVMPTSGVDSYRRIEKAKAGLAKAKEDEKNVPGMFSFSNLFEGTKKVATAAVKHPIKSASAVIGGLSSGVTLGGTDYVWKKLIENREKLNLSDASVESMQNLLGGTDEATQALHGGFDIAGMVAPYVAADRAIVAGLKYVAPEFIAKHALIARMAGDVLGFNILGQVEESIKRDPTTEDRLHRAAWDSVFGLGGPLVERGGQVLYRGIKNTIFKKPLKIEPGMTETGTPESIITVGGARDEISATQAGKTYRTVSPEEWQEVQSSGKFEGRGIRPGTEERNVTWVSDKPENAQIYNRFGDRYTVVFKETARQKSKPFAAGDRMGEGLTLDDVQRVYDNNGKVVYESVGKGETDGILSAGGEAVGKEMRVATNDTAALENYITGSGKVNYQKVAKLPKDANGNQVVARHEFNPVTKTHTIYTTEAATAENLAHELGHVFSNDLSQSTKGFFQLLPNYTKNVGRIEDTLSSFAVNRLGGAATSEQISKEIKALSGAMVDEINALKMQRTDLYPRGNFEEHSADAVRDLVLHPELRGQAPTLTALLQHAERLNEAKIFGESVAKEMKAAPLVEKKAVETLPVSKVNLNKIDRPTVNESEAAATAIRKMEEAAKKGEATKIREQLIRDVKDDSMRLVAPRKSNETLAQFLDRNPLIRQRTIENRAAIEYIQSFSKAQKQKMVAVPGMKTGDKPVKTVDKSPKNAKGPIVYDGPVTKESALENLDRVKKNQGMSDADYEKAKKIIKNGYEPRYFTDTKTGKIVKVERGPIIESALPDDVEMVKVKDLIRFREYDRRTNPKHIPEKLAALKKDIEEHGIGEPLTLSYGAEGKNAILGEGNNRLMIAEQLGIEEVPVRVIKSSRLEKSGLTPNANDPISVRGAEPDKYGYIPSNLRPSDIGIPSKAKNTERVVEKVVEKEVPKQLHRTETGKKPDTEAFRAELLTNDADLEVFMNRKILPKITGKERIGKSNEDIINRSFASTMTEKDFDNILTERFGNMSEDILAMKRTMTTKASELSESLAGRAIDDLAGDELKLTMTKYNQLVEMFEVFAGVRTELSNSFRTLGIGVNQGENDVLRNALENIQRAIKGETDPFKIMQKAAEARTLTPVEKYFTVWYPMLLSGWKTQVRNIVGNASNLGLETMSNLFTKEGRKEFGPRVMAIIQNHKNALNTATKVFKGEETILSKYYEPSVPTEGAFRGKAEFLNKLEYVGRFMNGTDAYFSTLFRESEIEGLRVGNYTYGLKDQLLAKKINEAVGSAAGLRGTFRNQFEKTVTGELGAMLTKGKTSDVETLRTFTTFVFPFVKTIANIADRRIDYVPIFNLWRTFRAPKLYEQRANRILKELNLNSEFMKQALDEGKMGVEATRFAESEANRIKEIVIDRLRNQQFGKFYMGLAVMAAGTPLAYSNAISGTGPEGKNQRGVLMKTGWRPNSFILPNGIALPYQNTALPTASILSILGNMNDSIRYGKDDADLTEKVYAGIKGYMRSEIDQSFLSGLSSIYDWLYGYKTFGQLGQEMTANAIPIPAAWTQLKDAVLPARYEAKSLDEVLSTKLGFPVNIFTGAPLQPKLDAFGDQMNADLIFGLTPPLQNAKTDDPVLNFMKEKGVFIGKPNKKSEIRDPNTGEKREITEAEYTEYVQESSRRIYEDIQYRIESGSFEGQSREEIKKQIDRIVKVHRKVVKGGLGQ